MKKKYLIFIPTIILILLLVVFAYQIFQLNFSEKNKKYPDPTTAQLSEDFKNPKPGTTADFEITTIPYKTAEQVVKSADSIIQGKILSSKIQDVNIGEEGDKALIMPYVIYKVKIEEVLKGKIKSDKTILLRMINSKEAPVPKKGESYLMPIHEYEEDILPSLYPSSLGFFDQGGKAIEKPNGVKSDITANEIRKILKRTQ